MKRKEVLRAVLVLLFCYAALSKLLDFPDFHRQMLNQAFAPWFNRLLVYLVPSTELTAVILLYFKKTITAGLWLSFCLMAGFTSYISLVLLHFWPRVPCSCGGILGHLSWEPHLVFNTIFLLITIIAIRSTGEAENPVKE